MWRNYVLGWMYCMSITEKYVLSLSTKVLSKVTSPKPLSIKKKQVIKLSSPLQHDWMLSEIWGLWGIQCLLPENE